MHILFSLHLTEKTRDVINKITMQIADTSAEYSLL